MSKAIDLNADMGEYADEEQRAKEAALMPLLSSCSIACGGHTGDAASMRTTARLAKKHGVSAGAHPSYPDRAGFGRRSFLCGPQELQQSLASQIRALLSILEKENMALAHVKPHGALYNDAAKDPQLASLVAGAIREASKTAILVGPPASALQTAAETAQIKFAAEGFVDRLYQASSALTPRSEPGAMIEDIHRRAAQALALARSDTFKAADGALRLRVKTLCIHSDSPGAIETAKTVRAALEQDGFAVTAFS